MTNCNEKRSENNQIKKKIPFDIKWQPARDGKVAIEVRNRDTDEVIETCDVNIQSLAARSKLVSLLAEKGCDKDHVEQALLQIASASRGVANKPDPMYVDELDPARIVRPDRFVQPGISGFTVPIVSVANNEPVGQWALHISSPSGPSIVPLAPKLEIGGEQYYVSPLPPAPSIKEHARWSKKSRMEWQQGLGTASPKEVFECVCCAIDRHIQFRGDLQAGYVALVSVWVILGYLYQLWPAVPYLLIKGPGGSGKSTLMEVLQQLCYNAHLVCQTTPSALYRMLHHSGGVLLHDEAEFLRNTKSELMQSLNSILLAGYKRSGAIVTINEPFGDSWRPATYTFYGPKAISCINGVLGTLLSRCIGITMLRADKTSGRPLVSMASTDWQQIRDTLYCCSLRHAPIWQEGSLRPCIEFSGRDAEKFGPLLAIASVIEADGVTGLVGLLEQALRHTLEESAELRNPEADQLLISILVNAKRYGIQPSISQLLMDPTPSELLAECRRVDKQLFANWTPEGISRRLANYGLVTTKSGGRRAYRCSIGEVVAVAERYGFDL